MKNINDTNCKRFNIKIIKYAETGLMEIRHYYRPIETQQGKKNNGKNKKQRDDPSVDDNNRSPRRSQEKIIQLALANDWTGGYFFTVTYNPKVVDSYNYEETSKVLSKWLKNIKRKKAPEMAYMFVAELHKSGRLHHHGMIKNIGSISLTDSGKRDKKGRTIYNMDDCHLGWTTLTKIENTEAVSKYLSKYVSKELVTLTKNKKRYWRSLNLTEPEIVNMFMDEDEINHLKYQYMKKTTSVKVAKVETEEYSNTIEYWNIKL